MATEKSMQTTVSANKGRVEVRADRGEDGRWHSEFRFIPTDGAPTGWTASGLPEGFISLGMALSAGILLGRMSAEEQKT
ncbi:hypothetical protein LMG18090_00350 [Ralstonia mannitolilytica]|uniref:hypothetical protein n=1 Tax=Ralstonia mannitolilytica TaxID=105219 RepID=UPI0028F66D38|nr:hypothetical protein [Ralstonia mannitolilytica]CAJ0774350.1 hypothetical protein LMG18090_00350 [Ralstonia mannitolilytica]